MSPKTIHPSVMRTSIRVPIELKHGYNKLSEKLPWIETNFSAFCVHAIRNYELELLKLLAKETSK